MKQIITPMQGNPAQTWWMPSMITLAIQQLKVIPMRIMALHQLAIIMRLPRWQ